MLRDAPRIYMLMFFILLIIAGIVVWYMNSQQRDGDALHLNDAVLTATVSEVDQLSRLYEGALLLADTFEPALWNHLIKEFNEGDKVQFDYMFDIEDDRFDNVETGTVSSPTYIIGGSGADIPRADHAAYMTGRPVQSVRVKVSEKNDNLGDWSYSATVVVDAASNRED